MPGSLVRDSVYVVYVKADVFKDVKVFNIT
jgi:hypothetical protein